MTKYIEVKDLGCMFFSDHRKHSDVLILFGVSVKDVVHAGFVRVVDAQGTLRTYGESITLGVRSTPISCELKSLSFVTTTGDLIGFSAKPAVQRATDLGFQSVPVTFEVDDCGIPYASYERRTLFLEPF